MNVFVFSTLLLILAHQCQSAGILHLELMASKNCILQLDHFTSTSDRLYSFLPKTQTIHLSLSDPSIDIGIAINSDESSHSEQNIGKNHSFRLENNGKWSETLIILDGVSLYVRSSFICAQGYFGDRCQHVSKPEIARDGTMSTAIPTTFTNITTSIPPVNLESVQDLNIERTIIYILLLIIVVLIFFIIFITCRHRCFSTLSGNKISSSNETIYSLGNIENSLKVSPPPSYTSTPFRNVPPSFCSYLSTPQSVV